MANRNMFLTLVIQIFLLIKFVVCISTAIDRTGWTATADSFQPGNEPAKAIDGNPNTFWHTKYAPAPAAPLPHWIVVDMKATFNVIAVSIQPQVGTNQNGIIGGHTIEVSTDNTNWQVVAMGTYNNDNSTKTTTFVTRQARYVRVTATSEAQSPNNPWTSIAELNVFNDVVNGAPTAYAAPVSGLGLWEKTVDFPLIPAAVSLLPNGQVLLWTAFARDAFGGAHGFTQTAIYNPTTGVSTQMNVTNTQHDMFCPGISLDFNGRVIVTGGSNAARTSIYDFSSGDWISASNMKIARGYQSSATCSDGRIFTIGGSWSGGLGGKNGEIYSPDTGAWTLIPNALVAPMLTADAGGIFRADNHAWLFGWKNQTVFQAGPSIAMNWYSTAGSGSTTAAGKRLDDGDAMTGIAVMFDATQGKILTAGGAPSYQGDNSRTNAYVITIGEPSTNPTVVKVPNMAYPRSFSNGVALPDGTVIVFGGQAFAKPFFDTTATLVPEMYNPVTNTWTQLNSMAIPRNYHSVALLNLDGTIMSAGGGVCGKCTPYGSTPAANHYDAEIFIPPYLLNADGSRRNRPSINSVASTVRVGATLSITTDSAVTNFALMRFGTATHTVDTDQRRIPLKPSSAKGNTYTVIVPADPGVTLPGYWMLFALDSNGTPSVAKTIKITL